MQINIKDYQEFNTPYDYSYCPDTDSWYKDEERLMPESKSEPTEIENFVLNDILGSSDNTKYKNQKEFQDFIAYNFEFKMVKIVLVFPYLIYLNTQTVMMI